MTQRELATENNRLVYKTKQRRKRKMLLFYVRHGEPIYIPDSLTELGHKQAEALVSRMQICNPDRIFASSSTRAIQTAEPTANKLQKKIEILDWCNEDYAGKEFGANTKSGGRFWCFGVEEVRRLFVSKEVRDMGFEWYNHPDFANENYKAGMERIQKESDAFFESLGYRHVPEQGGYIAERPNDDRIALFAHQGFGMAFLSCLLDIPYPQFCTHFDFSHSSITVIEFHGEGLVVPKMLQLSNDSHIFEAGMETKYNGQIVF